MGKGRFGKRDGFLEKIALSETENAKQDFRNILYELLGVNIPCFGYVFNGIKFVGLEGRN